VTYSYFEFYGMLVVEEGLIDFLLFDVFVYFFEDSKIFSALMSL